MSDQILINEFRFKSIVLLKSWPDSAENTITIIAEYLNVKAMPKMGKFIIEDDVYCAMLSPGHYMLCSFNEGLCSKVSALISPEIAAIVDVSHSRRAIRLNGENSTRLLNKGIAINLTDDLLSGSTVLQSSIHSIGIILFKFKTDDYLIFSYSSFFESFNEWVIDSALEYGYARP